MNRKSLHESMSRRFRKTGIAVAVSLICALAMGSAGAQVAVINPSLQTNNHADFASQLAKTIEQYSKQVQQYELQIQQYEQMLVKVQSLGTNFSLTANTLQPIGNPSALIQANCPSGSGGGIAGIAMSALSSLVSQPLDQSQQMICAQIVTTQVDKYNKTVAMINKIHGYSGALQNLTSMADSITTMGESNATTTQVNTYSSQIQTEMNNWEADMRADDAMISALQGQQTILAKMALQGGGSSILGDALPNSTFQSVF